MGRRITRKQLKQDEFVSTVDTFMRWFADRWRPFAIGLAAVCALIMLWWVAGRWSASRADQASYALYQAVTAADEAERTGEIAVAEERLQEAIDRHGSSDQADMARVYLSRIKMQQGDVETARALLVEVADRHGGDSIGRVATLDLVRLRVGTGQAAEVAQQLEAMVIGQDLSLPRDAALFELGELLVREQEPERARGYYQRLVDEFPESPYRSIASQRLGELG
jgi:predicted negative regulator of RcsB-dependent stress response